MQRLTLILNQTCRWILRAGMLFGLTFGCFLVPLPCSGQTETGGRLTDLLRPRVETSKSSGIDSAALPALARRQVGVTLSYDASYRVIPYPDGDVDPSTGVCSDVIIRALRLQGLDLQQAVHQDMRRAFSAYPRTWGLRSTDRNIDHRRVPNLEVWMKRQRWTVADSRPYEQRDYVPGDIVTWNLGRGLTHIGFVSDRTVGQTTRPLIIHNIGAGTREEDVLFSYEIRGHFRPKSGVTVPLPASTVRTGSAQSNRRAGQRPTRPAE